MITKITIKTAGGQVLGTHDILISEEDAAKLATILPLIGVTSKANLEITSGKNINIEPTKSIKFKPGEGAQIEFLADHTGDLTEVLLKALVSVDEDGHDLDKEKPIRFKFNCNEAEFNTKGADDVNPFDVKFKTGVKDSSASEHYCQTKIKARSIDLRCYEHGGIAAQICGADSNLKENKFKIETDRKVDVDEVATAADYTGEGGKGIEIGTINSQYTSLFTKEYRFKANAPIFAVTRGEIAQSGDKWDYPTQADDSKDIKNDDDPITWADVIAAVKYVKDNLLDTAE